MTHGRVEYAILTTCMQITRTLLSYGANPDTENFDGVTARQLVGSNSDLALLLDVYDTEGPAGFEDPPGTWRRFTDPSGASDSFSAQVRALDCKASSFSRKNV
jgi:hypothetical protein